LEIEGQFWMSLVITEEWAILYKSSKLLFQDEAANEDLIFSFVDWFLIYVAKIYLFELGCHTSCCFIN